MLLEYVPNSMGSQVYNDITPKDIVTDEWNRGYVEGFNAANNRK
jgi:hypothetical protein